ncbi:hypothetical protein [Sphingobium sp. CFD-1]|uniref:hypothetical protein n=1 Tax=Sphingobium sp. CFD-1 TaxID=2878545 RepID=UPI00214B3218|nr:hypothetical protein [Sphingobium sp. CFD-1]
MSDYHTQGPWAASGADMFGDHNITPTHETAAVAAVVSNLRSPLEVAANALLVASAPTMLKALQILQERYESDAWITDQEEMARVVRGTIAAATFSPEQIANLAIETMQ